MLDRTDWTNLSTDQKVDRIADALVNLDTVLRLIVTHLDIQHGALIAQLEDLRAASLTEIIDL